MAPEPQEIRPDPDALLAQVKAEEARQQRGKLKVFFGATAGVGKTYSMLSAGRAKLIEGVDIVVGYAEPHARPETEMLLLGMEILPYHLVEYRGAQLKEFDLDGALKRNPELILVDELAHSNAPGCRHAKRWQDVEELLDAGIDVYTTLNVQHLESLNDVVAQITGVVVRETLPDAMLEKAEEVELIDLTPEELLERLAEGKVYMPEQAGYARENFFRKPNLAALRELALRKTAERVGEQVESGRLEQAAGKTWPTAERILVCISPSPNSAKIIRSAKRMAMALHAEWIAAHVETPQFRDTTQEGRDELLHNFRLAERLGAETVTLSGLNPADEIVNYARARNVTKIIAGKTDRPWWRDLLFRSNVDQLLRKSGDIDIYVIRGSREEKTEERTPATPEVGWEINWSAYLWTGVIVVLCTGVAWGLYALFRLQEKRDLSNLIMIYLVGVAVIAARYGRIPSVIAAIASVAAFDFFFVPQRYTFAVNDAQYLITFSVMLGVALLIGTLTVRIREQADASRSRERRTAALYHMTEQLAGASGLPALAVVALRHLHDVFHSDVVLLMPDERAHLVIRSASNNQMAREESERAVAQWVFDHDREAGKGTDTLPASKCLYLPLTAPGGVIGVLGLQTRTIAHLMAPEQRQLLDAFLNQIALAIERDQLAENARKAQLQAETEKLRSSLLSSVSHDLRTPLAVITGASSSLLEGKPDGHAQQELIQTIRDESERLTRLVGNLLDITRLEAGAVTLNKQWQPIEEVIGSALNHLERHLAGREVRTSIPDDLPLVEIDGVLIEQVLVNLLENAIKYAPAGGGGESRSGGESGAGGDIDISARMSGPQMVVEVADDGPGLVTGEEAKIFEKFYRGDRSRGQRGAGLGLPICRAIVEVHGGRIWAENRQSPAHGAIFRFTIPAVAPAPKVNSENLKA